jgi:hypothetical protein
MLLALVFVNLWGVLQLTALGSLARTVRVGTVLSAMMAGVFFCAPLAAAIEYAWIGPAAAITGSPVEALVALGGYTVDPMLEEVIRILPLGILMLIPAVRRQWSVTDCVLVAAAAGAGFSLAEDLYRFSAAPQYARAIAGGWILPYGSWLNASTTTVFVPGIAATMGAWLPDTGGVRLFPPSAYTLPNLLLIWSALAGLAVGLVLRLEGPRRWYIALALLVYVSADHAANNADITLGAQGFTAPLRALRGLLPSFPLVALAVAWWIDRRRQAQIVPEHLLALERGELPRAAGTWRALRARMPYSIFWVERFVRLRRAYNTERGRGGSEAEPLWLVVGDARAALDALLQAPGSWRAAALGWKEDARRLLREPAAIVWIVLTLPATLWFVVGGWPATAGIQRLLSDGAGRAVVAAFTIAVYGWMAWRLFGSAVSWRWLRRVPVAEVGASMLLGVIGGIGTLGFGAFGFIRVSSAAAAGAAHVADAVGSLLLSPLLPLANAAAALWNALNQLSKQHIPLPWSPNAPVPWSERGYFTPDGIQRVAWNSLVSGLFNAADPFGLRRGLQAAGGPDLEGGLKTNAHSSDPDDWSEVIGTATTGAAELIFGHAMGAGAAEPGLPRPKGGVDPFKSTQPAADPLGKTQPAADPLGKTQPAAGPLDKTQPAPDPLAKTQADPLGKTDPQMTSPLAKSVPVDQFVKTEPQTTSPLATTLPGGPNGAPNPTGLPSVPEAEAAMNAARDEWVQSIREKMDYLVNRLGSAFHYEGDPAKWDPRTSQELSRRMGEAQQTYQQRASEWLEARRSGRPDP